MCKERLVTVKYLELIKDYLLQNNYILPILKTLHFPLINSITILHLYSCKCVYKKRLKSSKCVCTKEKKMKKL